MADPAECLRLAARIEGGEIGYAIDREVLIALGHLAICEEPGDWHGRLYRIELDGSRTYGGCGDHVLIDAVTTSLDDVWQVHERHFPDLGWVIGKGRVREGGPLFGALVPPIGDPTSPDAAGAETNTWPAAAWTAAILRTAAARAGEHG